MGGGGVIGLTVSDVRYTPAQPRDRASGLLGFVRFTLGGVLRLDGVALRRSEEGFLYLAFPRRTTRSGQEFPLMRPTSGEVRQAIEKAVIAALGQEPAP